MSDSTPQNNGGSSQENTGDKSANPQGENSKQQGGFVPPKSQEEFDRIIQERVARAKSSAADEVRKSYEGFKSADEYKSLEDKYNEAQAALNTEYRKSAVAEAGLPASMADRLQGENRDEWFSDAKSIAEQLAALAAPNEQDGQSGSQSASPRSNPREQRGVPGGNPGSVDDISVDDVLKNVNRF